MSVVCVLKCVREFVATCSCVGAALSLIRVVDNDLGAEGGAAVGRSLTALTALHTLNLSCKACFFMILLYDLFCFGVC